MTQPAVRDLLITDTFTRHYLSVRTASGLRNRFHVLGRGEPTIGGIVDTPDEELLRVPTIGPVAVGEVHRLRAAVDGASDAPAPPRETISQVRHNAERDPDYCPYCMRCTGLIRMKKVEAFYWRCFCGAEHDERRAASPAQEAPLPHPVRPHTPGWGGDL